MKVILPAAIDNGVGVPYIDQVFFRVSEIRELRKKVSYLAFLAAPVGVDLLLLWLLWEFLLRSQDFDFFFLFVFSFSDFETIDLSL